MKSTPGRYSMNFRELIEKLKKFEEDRGNYNCSDAIATEIIYKRIIEKGGLKEEAK